MENFHIIVLYPPQPENRSNYLKRTSRLKNVLLCFQEIGKLSLSKVGTRFPRSGSAHIHLYKNLFSFRQFIGRSIYEKK